MNTRQLQYIITLAEEKSFSEAANKLLISQPSLSQYVQKLEKELGIELFERTVPLKLTYAGETYLESAKKIISIEDELQERIIDIADGKRGKIYLGVGFLNSATLIPNIVNVYRQSFPDVELILEEDMEPNLKIKADAGELDLIFATSRFEDSRYERVELFQEDFLLAVPKCMSTSDKETSYKEMSHNETNENEELINTARQIPTISVDRVKDVPFILLKSNTFIRQIVENSFTKVGIKPKCAATCTSAIGAYGMAKAGVGATLIPYSTFQNDYSSNVEYYRLEDSNFKRSMSIYYNKEKYISRIVREFISISEEYFKTYGIN